MSWSRDEGGTCKYNDQGSDVADPKDGEGVCVKINE